MQGGGGLLISAVTNRLQWHLLRYFTKKRKSEPFLGKTSWQNTNVNARVFTRLIVTLWEAARPSDWNQIGVTWTTARLHLVLYFSRSVLDYSRLESGGTSDCWAAWGWNNLTGEYKFLSVQPEGVPINAKHKIKPKCHVLSLILGHMLKEQFTQKSKPTDHLLPSRWYKVS